MTGPAWVDPRTGVRWTNIIPSDRRVVAGLDPIPQEQRPGYVKFESAPPRTPEKR